MTESLKIPAIRFKQGRDRELYSFVVNGKDIPKFANIVRIGRDRENENEIFGYQRPEVFSHIKEIRRYLESSNPLMPNALVVAFESSVKFRPFDSGTASNCHSTAGLMEIPCAEDAARRIGWIVDGQQRTAAIRESSLESFPVTVVAFVANEEEQREQFILVNSTKPLPKDLIYELLPSTNTRLTQFLEKRKIPSELATRLNFPGKSLGPRPFAGRIKTPTNQSVDANISYNSVLKMLEHSLSDGILLTYTTSNDGSSDIDGMLNILSEYWHVIAETFPDAWRMPPSKSRLTHGAGIISLGFLMDAISERVPPGQDRLEHFRYYIRNIARSCAWTEGSWNLSTGSIKWNDVQNIPKHIESLSSFLLKQFLDCGQMSITNNFKVGS
jgi:DGQHR domain-containing protein